MATPTVYVICDQNCKYEGMTKEQILSAIMQAVNEGTISDIDAGFITSVKTINGQTLRFFMGEKSAYDALSEEQKVGLFAVITNDTTMMHTMQAIEELEANYSALANAIEDIIAGERTVGKATSADTTTYIATYLESSDKDLPVMAAEKTNGQARRMIRTGMTYNPSTDTLKVGNIDGYMKTEDGVQVVSATIPETTTYGSANTLGETPSGRTVHDIMFIRVHDRATDAMLFGGCVGGVATVVGVEHTRNGRTEHGLYLQFAIDEGDLICGVISAYTLSSDGTYNYYDSKEYTNLNNSYGITVYFK